MLDAAPTRLSQPRWRDGRLVAGVLLIALSVVVGARVVRAADTTVPVWRTARALPVGARIERPDLAVVHVRLDGPSAHRYADAMANPPVGRLVVRAVGEGELLPLAALAPVDSADAVRWITVPIPREHALGGRLRRGDLVDVVATYRTGQDSSTTRAVLRAVPVVEVSDGGSSLAGDGGFAVTLAVDPSVALELTSALRTAVLDLLLVGPGVQGDVGTRVVRGGAPGGGR